MRGIGRTLSRLLATRALVAGAALLAGATVERAFAQPQQGYNPSADDLALAIPRVGPRGLGLALPQPLAPSEAARLRRIFALQAAGDIPAALQETGQFDASNPVGAAMLGHLLADRYLGRFTHPDAPALQDWLARWSDLPDARAIHALLLVRLPRGAKPPPAPDSPAATAAEPAPVPEETDPADADLPHNPGLERAVREAIRAGNLASAQRLIAGAARGSAGYGAMLRGQAARVLFTLNRDAEAYDFAAAGVRICRGPDCREAALPAYVAGLAAWRMDQPDLAGLMFEAAWRAKLTTPAQQSAAAFWAARARLRTHDYAGFRPWMTRAAAQPSTFYGLLARRSLGMRPGIGGSGEVLTEADIDAVAATAAGLCGFALLQAGQAERAEAEFRRLYPAAQSNLVLARALMLIADRAGLIDLAAQLADLVQAADGRPRAITRFAVPRLRPAGGFTIDPAMVYALARTESNFDSAMVSAAGARGLMQIMPETARFIVGSGGLHGTLHDPALNLDLGQRYVAYLASHDVVGGDLIRLLASYNSGPGNFGHWSSGVRDNGDPLLFVEAIPVDETRAFVPRVLTYTWLYAVRLGLPAPSLDDLAVGSWPRYHPRETQTIH